MIRSLVALPAVALLAAAAPAAAPPDTWSAAELVDLATTHLAAGERGLAILDLERARLLAPRDPAIAAALTGARESAGVSAPEPSRLEGALGTLDADEWSWIALAAGALACAGVTASAWAWHRGIARPVAVAGALGCAIALGAMAEVAPSPARAIVLDATVAKLAPFAAAEPAFTAPAGEAVDTLQARGDFVYVRDADREGWMPRSAIAPVVVADRASART